MTTISVIIPAYNAEGTILETIESVQQQTFRDLEIIVIDDGSSDRTLDLLDTVVDERLKVYAYENEGVSTARNRGIAQATGAYISFIDADDLWTKDKLSKQLLALQQTEQAGVAYSHLTYLVESVDTMDNTDNISFVPGEKLTFTGNIYPHLLLGNFIGNGSNILARREAIESVGEFDPTLKSCEDWDYFLRLAAKWNFVLVPEPQIFYRKSTGTLTSNAQIMEATGLRVLKRAHQTSIVNHSEQQKNRSIANFYRYCSQLYLNSSSSFQDAAQARIRLWQAIRLYPAILLEKTTGTILVKLFLQQVLPINLVVDPIALLKKPFLIKDPR
jgi:glycosyltransferase involved in cell wall biosynthesis